MCLLVMQKQNTKIRNENLKNAYDSNPDGVGYSFINSKRKITTKKYRNYDKFLSAYQNDIIEFGNSSPFLLHFRLATHGQNKGTFNVHPFKVNSSMVFAHNGIISEVDDDKKLSDTQVFNRDILQELKGEFLLDVILVKLIKSFIGSSKLAFLNRDGSFQIINEKLGHWKDRVWYSNSSYKDKTSYSTESKWWKSYNSYGYDGYDDYGYGDGDEFNRVSSKKAINPNKHSLHNTLECNYCSDMVCNLTHYDVSDMYKEDEPSYMWMCDECVTMEEGYKKLETDYYDEKNSNKVAVMTVGKA